MDMDHDLLHSFVYFCSIPRAIVDLCHYAATHPFTLSPPPYQAGGSSTHAFLDRTNTGSLDLNLSLSHTHKWRAQTNTRRFKIVRDFVEKSLHFF